ncbi:MAG: AbrB/MazE/SpoVT family DNA-binding domain-containing protein [Lachnospiraceae bacterium]|nr:AbrB/MazE/SpoVT family DNA-binding domain-containing protein [Lachnospiraceae bacterium]
MTSQSTVKPWGNSQGIRLSKSVLKEAGIQVNDTVQIEVRGNTIILKKVFKHRTFEERLAEYDGKIDVQSFEWGEPEGREMF